MPIAFVIREATLSDVHAISTLLSDLRYPTTPDTMSARLAPILENPEHRTFVVVCNETVAGVIGTRVGRRYEDDRLYGQIMVLIVDARYRRKGLASALMKYVEPKLSDSTHFSENEGRTDASSDGRGFRVSSEGWRVAIFPREREQRP